ncbi:MAG: sulfatase [Verrucomicrobiales bacterium]|nr:sulfatase [Verrucomicrobiales bacterium]
MLRFLLSISLALIATAVVTAEERPPNVILILVDDMGWMDLSCQGSDYYKTPNIDRIANEGVRFTNGYASCAVCSPTRAAVQTGRYPHRIGVTDWIRSRFQRGGMGTPDANPTEYVGSPKNELLCPPNPFWMEHDEITVAEALGAAMNYESAYIGKWHLGDPDWYPNQQGFTVNLGGCDYGQPPNYFDPYNQPKGKHESLREGIPFLPGRKKGEYLTHREGDEALNLIRQWKDEPFFIQLSHYAVHTPIQAIPEVAARYEKEGKSEANAKYAAMVESVDDSTGAILDLLDELNLSENTLVIFTSDNGGLDNKGNPTDNAPLRSGKGYPHEGGIRVPLLVRWTGRIPAAVTSDMPVSSIDLFPTILDAASVPLPSDRPIDGRSLLPHLISGGKVQLDRDEIIWHFPHYRHPPGPYSIIRKGDWKLIKHWVGTYELYDLAKDLSEDTDLSEKLPDKVKELEARLIEALAEQEAKLPVENPEFVKK